MLKLLNLSPLNLPQTFMKICMLLVPRFFQDTGCVHVFMEWTPLQTGGGVLGMDARGAIVRGTPKPNF